METVSLKFDINIFTRQGCRPRARGAEGAMAPPPISTKGCNLCPPNNTGTPGFSYLPTVLLDNIKWNHLNQKICRYQSNKISIFSSLHFNVYYWTQLRKTYLISLVSICSIGYWGTSYGAEISLDNCFSATSGPMSRLAIWRILSPSICRLSLRKGAGLSDPEKGK